MFKKIAFTFGIKIIIALLNLAIVILLSQQLGAAGKGEASLIVTSIAMILIFCNLVGGSTLVYFVPRYNIRKLFLLSNIWSVFVCLAALFLFDRFELLDDKVITAVSMLSLINSFLSTNLIILLGKERITAHNIISLVQALLHFVILILLFRNSSEKNIDSYILSLYISMGLCFILSMILVFPILIHDKGNDEPGLLIKLLKFGGYSQAGHVMKFISFRCTYYMLSDFSGDVILGIFSNGVSLIESIFLISNSISTVLYPKVSNSEDIHYSRKITLELTRFSIILCVLALIPLMILPSSFYVWLFGNEFSGVHEVILILAPGILFYNVALVIGHYFSGIGKFRVNTLANFIGLISTVGLAIIYYPNFGLMEVGLISTISYILTALIIIYYFIKEAGIDPKELIPRISDFNRMKTEASELLKK
jgi:O-antigen/teichoic acid export membrane protein